MSTSAPPVIPAPKELPQKSATRQGPDPGPSPDRFGQRHETLSRPDSLSLPWLAWLLLALTAAVSLSWSRCKLLSQDEIFVLQTDSVSTLRQLIHVQRSTPISLDPLVYHLIGWSTLHLFRAETPAMQAFALRLPSLFGFLLMQACLLVFVRRCMMTGPRQTSAVVAARGGNLALALPALTAALFYSAEARPYGLLLGWCGVVMVSWQSAQQNHSRRTWALVVLALSLALALNTHYFAVLLLLPLGAAELHRLFVRRYMDWPMMAALLVGMSSGVFALPFQKAAGTFRAHYYNADAVTPHAISQAYRALLIDYTSLPFAQQNRLAACLIVFGVLFGAGLLRSGWVGRGLSRSAEWTFLLTLAALPFAGFLLGRFATHSFEVRYVLCALPGLSALFALVVATALGNRLRYVLLLSLITAGILAAGAWHVHTEGERAREYLASLQLSPISRQMLSTLADQHLYIQDVGQFEPAYVYAAEAALRAPLTLLYSREEELRWDGHDTASLTAEHLRQFSTVPTVSWRALGGQPGPHLLILYHSGWDWTDQALQASGKTLTPLGPAMGGDAVLLQ